MNPQTIVTTNFISKRIMKKITLVLLACAVIVPFQAQHFGNYVFELPNLRRLVCRTASRIMHF